MFFYIDLPFDDILSCGATCRTMNDALPLLKVLRIDKAAQMNLPVASRFRDVREIHINSLLKLVDLDGEGYLDMNIDFETKIRTVPFLSRFANLDRVYFWGKDADGNIKASARSFYWYEPDDVYPHECARDSVKAFLDMVSGGYSCGALHKDLIISGLCCPDASTSHGVRGDSCETCIRACKQLPLESVVAFDCRGTSSSNGMSGRLHCLDVCVERAKLESIIESRPGGSELLRSNGRLLRLLGSGRRYTIASDEGKSLYIVKYSDEDLQEIKRMIEYANLDVKKLPIQEVSNAIMRSFTGNGCSIIPPKEQRYISEESLDYLTNQIGLTIDKDYFERPLADLLLHAKQFAWVLLQGYNPTNDATMDYHSAIEIDCLKLIRHFLEVDSKSPALLQYPDLIPCLVGLLGVINENRLDAAYSLKCILEYGTEENRKAVIDAGALSSLSSMLRSPKDCIVEVALLLLVDIATKGTKVHIEAIANNTIIPQLIGLLDSEHDVVCSLKMLVAVKDHIQEHSHRRSSLFPHLIRLMKQENQVVDVLSYCSSLLCMILEKDKFVDLKLIPSLIEIMTKTEDDTIRMNLGHVMISIAKDDKSSTWRVLVEEVDFLPVLVSLVKSKDNAISEKAIEIAGSVADMTTEYRDLLLKAGIIKPLLVVLKDSNTTAGTLESTTSTFARCCRGNLADFATSKACLEVLTKLLSNNHEAVVANAANALFHVLNDLSFDEINEVVKGLGFINPLLKLLPNAPHNLQHPVLESLHLIATKGAECIKAISTRKGITQLVKVLSNARDEKIQELACCTISNIISGNKENLQIAIDKNAVPSLVQMLTEQVNRSHALWCMYQITKTGSADQIKHLLTEDCVNHLCNLLVTDELVPSCNNTVMSLWALKNVSLHC